MSSAIAEDNRDNNDESFDCTMFPDRTEDLIARIEEMLYIDNFSLKELYTLINVVKIVWPGEKHNFTVKESACTNDEIEAILSHRLQIRTALKASMALIEKHQAFAKMDKLKFRYET